MEQQPTMTTQPHTNTATPALPGPMVLLRTAWRAYTAHPLRYGSIALLPALYALTVDLLARFVDDTNAITLGVAGVMLILVNILVNAFTEIALIATVRDPEHPLTMRAAFAFAARNFLPLILVALLYATVTLGGIALLVLPGIALGVSLSFAQFAAINEGHRGFAALFRSREYVAGRWSDVFVRGLFLAVIAIPFSILLTLLGAGIDALSPVDVGDLVQGVLTALVGLPVGVLYTAGIYRALRGMPVRATKPASLPLYVGLVILGAVVLLFLLSSPIFLAAFM